MGKGILDRLDDGIVLGDGGYIVELEQRGYVEAGAFTPELAITHPYAIEALHRSREKLATVGYEDRTIDINQIATKIAKDVAGDELLIAGDLSTTWKWNKDDERSQKLVADMFDEQIEAQYGVDFFIGDLFFNLGEAMVCLDRIKKGTEAPAMITMSFRQNNITDDGFSASDCAKRLSSEGADIVGLNCMNDPEHMYPHIKEMRSAFDQESDS